MSIKTIVSLLSAIFICQILLTTTAALATDSGKNPTSAPATHNTNWYTIQISSSKEAQDAAKQVAILKTHGLDAVSSYETVEGKGMWYRVCVGRFGTRHEAETMGSRLKADGIISGYWIKVLKDPDTMPASSNPDRIEQSIAEKKVSLGREKQKVSSNKPVEQQVSPEDQIKISSPQLLRAEDEDAGIAAPSAENTGKPVEEVLSQTPVHDIKNDSDKPVEQQVSPEDQIKISSPQLLRAEDEDAGIAAPSAENAGKPVEEVLRQTPVHEIKNDYENRFTVAFRPASLYFPGLDKFTISSPTTVYYFEKKYISGALVPSFSFNRSFSLEGSIEKINSKFDFWYATLGSKWRLITSSSKGLFNLSPYIRGAFAEGSMSWDEAPGSFDTGLGWELGTGLDIITIRSNMKLGLETSYRRIKLDYNVPSGPGVTSSQSEIDFSGFSFAGFMSFYF